MKGFIASLIAIVLVAAAPVRAEAPPRNFQEVVSELRKEKKEEVTPSATGMVQGLLLCLGVFFVGVFAAKKLRGDSSSARGERTLRIVERLPLGGKSQLILIEVAGRPLLIGSTGDQITLLSPADGVKRSRASREISETEFAAVFAAEGGK